MGIFDKIFGKSEKVRVQFIDTSNGNTIGVSEMPPEQLPKTFEIETTMHLNDEDWSIEEAIPANSEDFLRSKKLTLKMRKVEVVNPKDLIYTIPTVSNEFPQTANSNPFSGFEFSIQEDDWRQNEFLNLSSLPLIEIETDKIQELKENHSKEVDSKFTAFTECHVRDTIGEPELELNLVKVKELLQSDLVGSLKITYPSEFILNGFSLKTDATTFYGTIENDLVTHFCVGDFSEDSVKEIKKVTEEYNLVFVNWYHCDIIIPNDRGKTTY